MLIIPLQLIGVDRPVSGLFSDISDASRVMSGLSRSDYLLTQSTVIVRYLQLMVFPSGQNVDYDYPVYHSFFHPEVILSCLLIVSMSGAGLYFLFRRGKQVPSAKLTAFGILWFFIALSVESSVIPILDVIFEHRVYLPSVGFFVAVAVSLTAMKEKLEVRYPWIRKAAPVAAGLIITLLAGAAYARNMVWQDELTFWSDVVEKSPNKPRGYLNLGLAYQNRQDLEKALAYYNKALSIKALSYPPLVNRGTIYAALGRHEQAIKDFSDAISINPYVTVAHYNRGMSYVFLGQKELAVRDFTSVIELKPNHADAYNNRGSMYGDMGETEKAIADFTSAISLTPDFAGFYSNRGHAYMMKQDFEGAVRDFSKAIELKPNEASWLVTRGTAYKSLGDREKAEADFRKACAMGIAAGCEAVK
jgi:protein O-mannosyl-transferase